jgi:hypothetical protein
LHDSFQEYPMQVKAKSQSTIPYDGKSNPRGAASLVRQQPTIRALSSVPAESAGPAYEDHPERTGRSLRLVSESPDASAQRFLNPRYKGADRISALLPQLADLPRFPPRELEDIMNPNSPLDMPESTATAWVDNLDGMRRRAQALWNDPSAESALRSGIASNYASGMNAQQADGSLSSEGAELALAADFRSNPGELDSYKSFGSSKKIKGAEAKIPHLEVAHLSVNGRVSNEIVRIRDASSQRNLLYVAGRDKPFFEFPSNAALGQWVSNVLRKDGKHAFDLYFPVDDRVQSTISNQPQLGKREAISTLLKNDARATAPNSPARIDWDAVHSDDGRHDFMATTAIAIKQASTQDIKLVRQAALRKLQKEHPNFREHQAAELKETLERNHAEDVRVATRLYERINGPVPTGQGTKASIESQKKILNWTKRLSAAPDNADLRQTSNESLDAAVADLKEKGTKVDALQAARLANDKDNVNELARQLTGYSSGAVYLGFSRPVQVVQQAHPEEDFPPKRWGTRQNLERQREALNAMQRLSTAAKGREDYLAISDRAWQSAALSAEMKAADTGKREDILDTATTALMFQRAFDHGGADNSRILGALMAQLDIPRVNQIQLEKLWPPATESRTPLERVVERRRESREQALAIEKIANTLMGSDERLIPVAQKYNAYYKPESGRDGAFQRVLKLQATMDDINRIPESSMFSGLLEEDLQKARKAFKPSVKGATNPSVAEFLELAQGFAVAREFKRLGNARDDVKKVPIRHTFDVRTDYSNYQFKDFTKSLSQALDNPFGEFSAEIMRAKGYSDNEIERVKMIGKSAVDAIDTAALAAPGGNYVAWRPIAASISKIVHRRVSADKPYSLDALQEDVKDAASVIWNLASSAAKKERFNFLNNRYIRFGL